MSKESDDPFCLDETITEVRRSGYSLKLVCGDATHQQANKY